MAPRITVESAKPLSQPHSAAEQAVQEMRKQIESDSVDVGTGFAAEARKIHAGESPNRTIVGEAKLEEARALVEDGIPIMPLPWRSKQIN